MTRLFTVFFILPTIVWSQSSLKFQQRYGDYGYEYGYGIVQTWDNGYAIAGSSSSAGTTDGYLVRTDSMGVQLWTHFYTLPQIDIIRSIALLPDSGFIMAGFTSSTENGDYDGWLIRADKNGDTLWTRQIGTSNWDFFYSVTPTWDNGFLCVGGTYGLGAGDEDIYLVKLDNIGNTIWTRTYGGIKEDEARSIVRFADSLYAMAANTKSKGDTLGDGWLLCLNKDGDTLWSRTSLFADTADALYDVSDDSVNQRILVCGKVDGGPVFEEDMLAIGYDYDGIELSRLNSKVLGIERYNGIAVRPDGYYGTLGYTSNQGWANGDIWFFSEAYYVFTTFGQQSGSDELFDLTGTRDKGFAACGFMTPQGNLPPDIYLVKIDSTGFSTTVLGIAEDASTENGIATITAFPNPVTTDFVITINSRQIIDDGISISLVDASGRDISDHLTINWQENNATNYTATVNSNGLSAGIYFYSIKTKSQYLGNGKLIIQSK